MNVQESDTDTRPVSLLLSLFSSFPLCLPPALRPHPPDTRKKNRKREETTWRQGQEENREGQLLRCPSSAFFFIRVVLSFRRREGL